MKRPNMFTRVARGISAYIAKHEADQQARFTKHLAELRARGATGELGTAPKLTDPERATPPASYYRNASDSGYDE